ncbi:MAG TPA: biotin/lipoyl-binding protein, partial [Polyangiaceae bacterium]|nr:biotin/lipoyl-binding protein [Polyangiaceae bacterium]
MSAVTTAPAAEGAPAGAAPAELAPKAKAAGRGPMVLGALLALALAGAGYGYVTHHGRERTDDAQIDAEVVAVPARAAGLVLKVAFVENQRVTQGDVLAELDPTPARARLAQADAALATAKAAARAAEEDAK